MRIFFSSWPSAGREVIETERVSVATRTESQQIIGFFIGALRPCPFFERTEAIMGFMVFMLVA